MFTNSSRTSYTMELFSYAYCIFSSPSLYSTFLYLQDYSLLVSLLTAMAYEFNWAVCLAQILILSPGQSPLQGSIREWEVRLSHEGSATTDDTGMRMSKMHALVYYVDGIYSPVFSSSSGYLIVLLYLFTHCLVMPIHLQTLLRVWHADLLRS